ncbi:YfhO family protein [Streptomyces showdoensis]|uniref:Membrane protein n=1 Tax=Streptomyces showdoensis TaxID=68268 RepID=A0A2P2GKF1_STREW|nr:YfhO family protein [Streptomyces showdoensis]KKZ71285.1 membrane protein [Streptomyces showdoensis]
MKIRIPRAAGLAALLTVLAVCAGDAVASTFPFGRHRRGVNDLANQFLPFHAHLWDLLHGRADGGLLLNWRSGWGSSFLPDLGTYLTSPFAPLVALFPRADLAYALYAITVLKTAAAAAAMAWALLRIRPGVWWAAGLLGAAYGLCGWALLEAVYNPMWMDGLIAFPLLCLVGVWVREGRRPLLGTLVVAVCWTANFYTAYMATLGAALVLLVTAPHWRTLLRGAVTVLLGVGLSAPLLLPVFLGTRHAHPGVVRDFAAADGADLAARLMPATYGFSTPALFVFTVVPVLAAALLFRREGPAWRWPLLAAAVALSFQWGPTHLVWHVFATPNGSPYRQTFVLTGVLVLAAWQAVADGLPERRALLGGTALILLLALPAVGSAQATGVGWALFAAGLAAPFLVRRGRPALLVLAAVLVAQAAATTAWGDKERLARLDDYPAWSAADTRRAAALAEADGWPAYRTDSGRPQVTGNEPMLLGGQGAAYYSSLTPDVLTRTLAALGGGWTSRGRNLQSLDNPVTDALFAVGARWRDGAVVRTGPAAPLVTVRPPGPPPVYGPSPFRNQERLLGARVYEPPGPGGACRPGTETFLWAPDFTGTARLGDRTVKLRGQLLKWRAALTSLGTPARPSAPVLTGRGHRGELACLDHTRLRTAVAALRSTAPTTITVTSTGFRATLPPGTRGTVVLAAPRIAGWHCEDRPADAYGGLVATPADGRTSVTCSFRPPGLRAGLGVGGAAAVLLALWVAWTTARTRAARGTAVPKQDPSESNSLYHALT